MTEVLDELSAIDEPVKLEDRVVYLLASFPECYNVVTALEAKCSFLEGLLSSCSRRSVRTSGLVRSKKLRCHFCHKLGHYKGDLSRLCEIPV